MSIENAIQRMNELSTMLSPGTSASNSAQNQSASPGFAQQLSLAQQQWNQPGEFGDESSFGNLPRLNNPYGMQGGYGAPGTAGTALYPGSPYGNYGNPGGYGQYGYPSSFGQYGAQGGYPVGGPYGPYGYSQPVGQQIVNLARKEIGVSESPPGSNDGTRIREYRTATAGANSPGPWCAYFVSYLCKQAGAPIGAGGAGTGYVPTLEQWGRNTGRYFSGQLPQPGDIAIFNFGGGIANHTGIVESVDADGTIHTIEGNSSDRVSQRTYKLSQIKGFVHPG